MVTPLSMMLKVVIVAVVLTWMYFLTCGTIDVRFHLLLHWQRMMLLSMDDIQTWAVHMHFVTRWPRICKDAAQSGKLKLKLGADQERNFAGKWF